ncbi:MAG: hypothetical protein L3K03_08310, partial [Thermoplasmata archaeon]|nr:hypothetical protein [Thermoplasmata archaeon]
MTPTRRPPGRYRNPAITSAIVALFVLSGWATTLSSSAAPSSHSPPVNSAVQTTVGSSPAYELTFNESGLPAGLPWSVDLLGNVSTATSPNVNSVVIPAGTEVSFQFPNVPDGWGTVFANGTPSSPGPILVTHNLSIDVPFSKKYLVTVSTVPSFPQYPYTNYCDGDYPFSWDDAACPGTNYEITPLPGSYLVKAGGSFDLNISPAGFYCAAVFGCSETEYANLSFMSWIGNGSGSVSQTAPNATLKVNGPINETASFEDNGWCQYEYAPVSLTCYSDSGTILFEEVGLPTGTQWNLTASGDGQSVTTGNITPWIPISQPFTSNWVNFTAWTVPASGGQVWVPTADPVSPVILPGESLVLVNYTLRAAASESYATSFEELGLPAGTPWTVFVDGNGYGSNATVLGPIALASSSHVFGGGAIYLANGTGYEPTGFATESLAVNESGWINTTGSETNVTTHGPGLVDVNFQPSFEVTAESTSGGSTSFASAWVAGGTRIWLNATNDSGFSFLGWTGSGAGSYTGANSHVQIIPSGPVSEIGVFGPTAPVTWTVTVTTVGLPSGAPATLNLGGRQYTGSGVFQIPDIAPGTYNWSAPYWYLNSSELTRFVETGMTSTYTEESGPSAGSRLVIDGNGSITLDFAVEYLVSSTVQGAGTVTVASAPASALSPSSLSGSEWAVSGSTVWFNATPSPGFAFGGFTGSGAGGQSGAGRVLSVTAGAPLGEVATFLAVAPVGPRTFTWTITESGLPAALTWNASVGSIGASGKGTKLVIGELNGTYS